MENDNLRVAREEYQRKLRVGEVMPQKQMDPTEKAKKYPKSLRAAINSKCFDCCCSQKAEIKYCPAQECPLHTLRPYQEKPKISEEKI